MKALICGMLLLSAMLPAQSSAQEQVWMTDSSWAIQFGVQGYLTVWSFDAASISAKTHITSLQALRIGLKMSGLSRHSESLIEASIGDSTLFQDMESYWYNDLDLRATVQYLWYLDTKSDLFVFLGVGPTVGYRWSEHESGAEQSAWQIGISPSIGAEWFATRRISFHAEYQATLSYEHSVYREVNDYPDGYRTLRERTYNTWSLSANEVVFGLSVYFEL